MNMDFRPFAPKKRCVLLFSDECTSIDRLPTVDAFRVLYQCVIALRLLFCAGWVHRDVSVGNVLAIKDPNGTWKVKLADLEYAKKFENGTATADPKTGTPYFMAHEILGHDYIIRGKTVEEEIITSLDLQTNTPETPAPAPVRHNFQHDLECLF
ncbi:hypothetical protein EST38_g12546 [Candolleomyces aberdarensis]|uniref:Protein kinase domain-containing protein n=1 Tax=Candolleomyces aberdarensis TaxID=2316362 RepID=A0A4Q2D2X9_9AGAR|nr:hypothetical protein EST38_g12546 [Candolleomyces aberdarensis]